LPGPTWGSGFVGPFPVLHSCKVWLAGLQFGTLNWQLSGAKENSGRFQRWDRVFCHGHCQIKTVTHFWGWRESVKVWGPALDKALAETPLTGTEAAAGPLYLLEQKLGFSQTQPTSFMTSLYILK